MPTGFGSFAAFDKKYKGDSHKFKPITIDNLNELTAEEVYSNIKSKLLAN